MMSEPVDVSEVATPSQTRDAAELLLDQLDYWRNLAARRKMRSELLAIRLAAAEKVCESATPGQRYGYVIDGKALDDWRLLVGGESDV